MFGAFLGHTGERYRTIGSLVFLSVGSNPNQIHIKLRACRAKLMRQRNPTLLYSCSSSISYYGDVNVKL